MTKMLDFLRLCVSNSLVPLSWGISNIVVKEGYVTFTVKGNKYQGLVEIRVECGEFRVTMKNTEKYFRQARNMFIWLDEYIE